MRSIEKDATEEGKPSGVLRNTDRAETGEGTQPKGGNRSLRKSVRGIYVKLMG